MLKTKEPEVCWVIRPSTERKGPNMVDLNQGTRLASSAGLGVDEAAAPLITGLNLPLDRGGDVAGSGGGAGVRSPWWV